MKDRIGLGYYVRQKHEHLLIARRGAFPAPKESDRLESVFYAPRQEHSEKPNEAFARIERMYPGQRYLELFSRTRREGWDTWGNQSPESPDTCPLQPIALRRDGGELDEVG